MVDLRDENNRGKGPYLENGENERYFEGEDESLYLGDECLRYHQEGFAGGV